MNRLKSPYFWFAFIPGLFVVVVLVLSQLQKKDSIYFSQESLRYRKLSCEK